MTGNPHHDVTNTIPFQSSWLPVSVAVLVGLIVLGLMIYIVVKNN